MSPAVRGTAGSMPLRSVLAPSGSANWLISAAHNTSISARLTPGSSAGTPMTPSPSTHSMRAPLLCVPQATNCCFVESSSMMPCGVRITRFGKSASQRNASRLFPLFARQRRGSAPKPMAMKSSTACACTGSSMSMSIAFTVRPMTHTPSRESDDQRPTSRSVETWLVQPMTPTASPAWLKRLGVLPRACMLLCGLILAPGSMTTGSRSDSASRAHAAQSSGVAPWLMPVP